MATHTPADQSKTEGEGEKSRDLLVFICWLFICLCCLDPTVTVRKILAVSPSSPAVYIRRMAGLGLILQTRIVLKFGSIESFYFSTLIYHYHSFCFILFIFFNHLFFTLLLLQPSYLLPYHVISSFHVQSLMCIILETYYYGSAQLFLLNIIELCEMYVQIVMWEKVQSPSFSYRTNRMHLCAQIIYLKNKNGDKPMYKIMSRLVGFCELRNWMH